MKRTTSFALIVSIALIIALAGFGIATPVMSSDAAQTDPTVTPMPPIDALEVAEIIDLPLLAGPGRTSAYLAPDGRRIAYLNGPMVCTLDIATAADYVQAAVDAGTAFEDALDDFTSAPNTFAGAECVSLAVMGDAPVDTESIRWSPDGRYLVMTENFFRLIADADIWVIDTATVTLTNLTDDGIEGSDYSALADNVMSIDITPRWMADGRIVFLRYTGTDAPAHVYTIQPDGSDLRQVGQIENDQGFDINALAVSAEGTLAYSLWVSDEDLVHLSGVWISDLDGSHARQPWYNAEMPNRVPIGLDWSPDGQYISFNLPADFNTTYEPATSTWRILRVNDGQELLVSDDHYVRNAGWAPEGSAMIYTTANLENSASEGLYVAAAPGAPGRMLVPAHTDQDPYRFSRGLMGTTSLQSQCLPWTAHSNTVFVGGGAKPGVLIIRLEVP